MIDAPTQALLVEILRRECRSPLAYIAEAYPWASYRDSGTLARLQQILRQDADAVTRLGRDLVRARVNLPPLPPFAAAFTDLNFIDLKCLLPRLIDAQRQAVTRLEGELTRLPETCRAGVDHLLQVKRTTLEGLDQLSAPAAGSV